MAGNSKLAWSIEWIPVSSKTKQNKTEHLSCCPTNVELPGGLLQAAFSGLTIHHSPKPCCYFLGSPCSVNFSIEVKHEASCLKAVDSARLSAFITSYCHLCSSSTLLISTKCLVPKKHSLPSSPKVNTCQTLIFVSQESHTLDISLSEVLRHVSVSGFSCLLYIFAFYLCCSPSRHLVLFYGTVLLHYR